jgi:hypothetical protein
VAWGRKKKQDIKGGKGKPKEPFVPCGKPIHRLAKREKNGSVTTPICQKQRGHFGGC